MRGQPARPGEISLDFAEVPPRWDKNFSNEHAQEGQSGKAA